MVSFLVYDIVFLVFFSLFVFIFLYKRRKNLERQSLLFLPVFLYRSKFGIKSINYIGDKYSRCLHFLKYIVITMGFFLMGIILYLFGSSVITYLRYSTQVTQLIKAPPIAPLIPYFPALFGLQSFFPPLYFTYFIIALAIVAISHEFFHGIFMRLFKIKIKSTGFAFFGPFLGAFVEEDRKNFEKKKVKEQMAVLSAGVFANLIFAILFFGLLVLFFNLSFSPSGYVFNSYPEVIVPVSSILGFSNFSNENVNLIEINSDRGKFYIPENVNLKIINQSEAIIAWSDAPAIKSGLNGTIIQLDETEIKDYNDLSIFLENSKPGDLVLVKTRINNSIKEYELVLDEHPENSSRGYLGVGFRSGQPKGFGKVMAWLNSYKKPSTEYVPSWDGNFVIFIYNLLWWVAVINILVALFNMLPLGILDGGRFFYLTIFSITGSKKFAEIAFKFATYLILLSVFLMMVFWFLGITK